jgi:hypothetical protein
MDAKHIRELEAFARAHGLDEDAIKHANFLAEESQKAVEWLVSLPSDRGAQLMLLAHTRAHERLQHFQQHAGTILLQRELADCGVQLDIEKDLKGFTFYIHCMFLAQAIAELISQGMIDDLAKEKLNE